MSGSSHPHNSTPGTLTTPSDTTTTTTTTNGTIPAPPPPPTTSAYTTSDPSVKPTNPATSVTTMVSKRPGHHHEHRHGHGQRNDAERIRKKFRDAIYVGNFERVARIIKNILENKTLDLRSVLLPY